MKDGIFRDVLAGTRRLRYCRADWLPPGGGVKIVVVQGRMIGGHDLGLQFVTDACSPLAGDALAAIPSRKESPANGLLQQNCSRGPEGFLGRPINLRHSGEVPFDSRRAGRAG